MNNELGGQILPPNKSPAYQRYPDKWLVDTRRLSWTAKGIYADLLEIIWMQFQDTCSIPDDDDFISAALGCDMDTWLHAKGEILYEFLPLLQRTENPKNPRLFSRGLWKERQKQLRFREKQRENGLKGGRPRKGIPEFGKPKESPSSPSPSSSPTTYIINNSLGKNKSLEEETNTIPCVSGETPERKSESDTEKRQSKKFVPPTLDKLKAYIEEAKLEHIDPEAFIDYFTSNGWKVGGKGPMKDWKAAARNWNRNHKRWDSGGRSGKPISDRRKTELQHKAKIFGGKNG